MTQQHTGVVAIYPGSFDPITNGHLDVIERGSRLFDRLIVSVLRNEAKAPLFTVQERIEMLRETVSPYANVEVDSFDGLLADYAVPNDGNKAAILNQWSQASMVNGLKTLFNPIKDISKQYTEGNMGELAAGFKFSMSQQPPVFKIGRAHV